MTPRVRGGAAIAVALVLHVAMLAALGALGPGSRAGALFWVDMNGSGRDADADGEGAPDEDDDEVPSDDVASAPVALVLLDRLPPELGTPPEPVQGAGEEARLEQSHPSPDAAVDVAGARAARAGGVREAGSRASTGRDDREDKRAQLWSDARRYQLPRQRTSRVRRSDEAIARAPIQAFDDRRRVRTKRAREGQDGHAPPAADGTDASEVEIAEADAPDDALPASDPEPQQVVGVLIPGEASPLVMLGPLATEATVDGRVRDNASAIASSDETDPAPFDLTRPAAGGEGRWPGVRGRGSSDGRGGRERARRGHAASRVRADRGAPELAVQAWRTDPYFRTMYAQLDGLVRYPRALARSLEQGEVVVRFTLFADGRVSRVRVEKSSGYEEFDEQVTSAIARAAPFGPVPADVLQDRRAITVRAPYAFRNPWIR